MKHATDPDPDLLAEVLEEPAPAWEPLTQCQILEIIAARVRCYAHLTGAGQMLALSADVVGGGIVVYVTRRRAVGEDDIVRVLLQVSATEGALT